MKRTALGLIAIICLICAVRAYAAFEMTSYHFDPVLKDAEYGFQHGAFVTTNSIDNQTNDTIETTQFVADSQPVIYIKKGGDFIKETGALIQQNAVNVNTMANIATDGLISNVTVAGFDTSKFDATTNKVIQ